MEIPGTSAMGEDPRRTSADTAQQEASRGAREREGDKEAGNRSNDRERHTKKQQGDHSHGRTPGAIPGDNGAEAGLQ